MNIKVNNVEITLTEEQCKQIAEKYNKPKPEYEYPLFKIDEDGLIIKYARLNEGTVVWKGEGIHPIGFTSSVLVPHTHKSWEDVAYDQEKDLWDRQPITYWDNGEYRKFIGFYDAVSKGAFNWEGRRNCATWDNHKAIPTAQYDEWTTEAYNKLEK